MIEKTDEKVSELEDNSKQKERERKRTRKRIIKKEEQSLGDLKVKYRGNWNLTGNIKVGQKDKKEIKILTKSF